ncbi:MAG: Bax inhibitor-1/YccA family protein [Hyphomicrobiaceae bacterium]|nr:Bax inhibitor-1/YccA family protein [Hyphomicrobiaceae bacterium]
MAEIDNRYARGGFGARTDVVIDEGLRAYMLRVYNYMALGVAGTAVVSLLVMSNPALMRTIALGPMKWVLFFGVLGLGWFAPRIIFSGNAAIAHGAYWLYCALWGVLISPFILAFFAKNAGGLVFQALAIAAVTFGATSLYGYVTKRDMTGWGSFLSMASIGLIVAMLVSFFVVSDPATGKTVSFIISALVVLLFSAVTAWETQQIKDMYVYGAGDAALVDRSAVFGSFMLYGSFITLFIHILNILGIMRSE